jgi:hypothetical protein
MLLGLLNSYHQHVISTFNTCSQGANLSVLNRHRRGYNLEGAGSPHHTPQPFQPTVLHFPPNGPVRSYVIHLTITNWFKEGTSHTSHEWEPPLDFYCNLSSKYSITNGKTQRDRITRIIRKVNLNTTLEVPAHHITLPDLFNRRSSTFYLRTPPGLMLFI